MAYRGTIKYPEYEVVTPQSHQSFMVRSLNVQEEEKMKGSLITPAKITEHLNRCIFDVIVKKPEDIKTYEDYLKKTTLRDRDALLYGVYHISYKEVRDYNVTCSSCNNEYPVTVNASDTFNMVTYPGKDILNKTIKFKLPISKDITVYIKQPTIWDEEMTLKTLSTTPGYTLDILTNSLCILKIEQKESEAGKVSEYTNRSDIVDVYLLLAAMDRRSIIDKYLESFGKYKIDLKMQTTCRSCGIQEVIDIDLAENFFRLVYTS